MTTDRAKLLRRGLLLEYATLSWNVLGVVALSFAARAARSLALAGFGADSLIEILASVVVVWQLKGGGLRRERIALRAIAVSFVLLAVYITIQAAYVFWSKTRAAPSIAGMAWLAVTAAVMAGLAAGKRATGRALENRVLISEAGVTTVDAYLAGSVLVGVSLNTLLGWWWADPLSGLIIAFYGLREAREAWAHASSV